MPNMVVQPQALSFDEHTPPADAGEQWRRDADAFQHGLVHLTSLLHGLAMQAWEALCTRD